MKCEVKVRGSESPFSSRVWTGKKKDIKCFPFYTERWSDWDLNPSIVWLHVLKSLDCFTQLHVDIDCTQEWSAANVVTLNSSETRVITIPRKIHTPPPPSTTWWLLYHMYQLYQVSAGSVDLKFCFNHHSDKFFFFVTFLKPVHTDTYAFLILHCLLILYVPIVWPK